MLYPNYQQKKISQIFVIFLLPIRQGILLDNHSILIVEDANINEKAFHIKIKNICVELFKKKKVSKNIYNSVVNCLIEYHFVVLIHMKLDYYLIILR